MYLFYTVGLTLCALIWVSAGSRLGRRVVPPAVVTLAAIAIFYQAGQSTLRGELRIVRGVRDEFVWFHESPRAQLWLPRNEADLYARLLSVIQSNSNPQDEILALPVNPELYFLTGRKCPVRFFNSALGLRHPEQLHQLQQQILERPPTLVVLRPNQVYNTPLTRQLMESIRQRYTPLECIGDFEIYQIAVDPDPPAAPAPSAARMDQLRQDRHPRSHNRMAAAAGG
jgi:hypothetical protein